MRSTVMFMITAGLVAAPLSAGAAQGMEPLRKVDLVQLLTERVISTPEIAELVRRNCLAFRPTQRDLDQLRVAGADAAVMAAVDECMARRPAPATAGGGALRVLPWRARVEAAAGRPASVVVEVRRGTAPVAGVALLLRGSAAIPGGAVDEARAVTNSRGVAEFVVLAGTRVGTYPLSVAAADGTPLGGSTTLALVSTAGPPAAVVTLPSRVVLTRRVADRAHLIRVFVRDTFENAVPGARVELRSRAGAALGAARTTSAVGEAAFTIPPGLLQSADAIDVYVQRAVLGTIEIARGGGQPAPDRTAFVAGRRQRGLVGTALPELLVLEVRDSSGAAVLEEPVEFVAVNARVEPVRAVTDSVGRVAVRVTLGERAGPADIRAQVAGLTVEARLAAEAGPAARMVVERDGVVLSDTLITATRAPVVLRVRVQDALGNPVPVDVVQPRIADQRVARIRGSAVSDTGAVVTLLPRGGGTTDLELRALGIASRLRVTIALPRPPLWTAGLRLSWVGFHYSFPTAGSVDGRPGVAVDGSAGLALGRAARLVAGAGYGTVSADTGGAPGAVNLVEVYLRGEYFPSLDAAFAPVLTAGGGLYQLRPARDQNPVHHASLFWMFGTGADVVLNPRARVEIRLLVQQLEDVSSPFQKGHVGSLIWMGAGVRLRL